MKSRVRLILTRSGAREEVVVSGGPTAWTVERAGTTTSIDAVRLSDGRLSLLLADGRQICGLVTFDDGAAVVTSSRGTTRVPIENPSRRGKRATSDAGDESGEEVRALMPGRVIEVGVSEGQSVAAGTILLVLEAMKMQNEIRASRGGVVARVGVAAGQAVDRGALLVAISPPALSAS
ncbi:MAG TPA: biotin/lipoyl-containing protein [Thermoanaerobaculia bacterium]|nr:biotin/lipoyl-containing protein [Thermoanaerobaculia bacterium]